MVPCILEKRAALQREGSLLVPGGKHPLRSSQPRAPARAAAGARGVGPGKGHWLCRCWAVKQALQDVAAELPGSRVPGEPPGACRDPAEFQSRQL